MLTIKEDTPTGIYRFLVMFDGKNVDRISSSSLYQFVDANVLIHFENGVKMDVNDYLGESICSVARNHLYC